MMHPMAGQAWNQSVRDISYIADAIAESDNLGINIISTPSYMAFKRVRKIEGVSMVNSIDFINNVYNSNSSISLVALTMGLYSSNILFNCCGCFSGLEDIIRYRCEEAGMGFGAKVSSLKEFPTI